MNLKQHLAVIGSAALTAMLLIGPAPHATAQRYRTITLDAGTVIPVKLRDTLSSLDSQVGDKFTATLQSDEAARSLQLPIGTFIEGTVSAVHPMEGKDGGVISLSFDRVVLPNESSYPIHGSLIGLDDKSVTRSSNGRVTARPDMKNKTLVYAGYGAGAGLILGALTRGNTILDTLLGGGLGYLLGSLDKNHGDPKDVVLKPNTELGVRIDRQVNFKVYDDGTGSIGSTPRPYRRTQPDSYGDPVRSDPNRDPYDEQSSIGRPDAGADRYQLLSQYTDIRDNGEPIGVIVGGHDISFLSGARPFISGGTVMVPVIPVLKAVHERYTYSSTQFSTFAPDEQLTVTFNNRTVAGSSGHRYTLPAAVQRRNGTIYAPMQFLSLVTGERLSFDRESQTVDFSSSQPVSSRR